MPDMKIRLDQMETIAPITPHQEDAWQGWRDGDHLALTGTAGTGKTFLAMYLALEEVMDKSTPFDTLHIIRSVVPTREMGYLPGTIEEKKPVKGFGLKMSNNKILEAIKAHLHNLIMKELH